MIILSNLLTSKVSTDFIDNLSKLLYRNQLILIWDKESHYNLYKTDLKTPVASFDLFLYHILIDSVKLNAVAITSFTPEIKYKNRTIIRTIFECITETADRTNSPLILKAKDLLPTTLKFKEDNLITLGFTKASIMNLQGIKSNFEYIRLSSKNIF